MLQNIRDKLTGRAALVILAVIALSFVFVGGASFTTIGNNYAAKVDGVDIGLNQFESAYRDQIQDNPQLAALPDEYRLQLRRNVLEQLVQQRVIDNYLDEAGFRISDEQIAELIQEQPEFQVDGEFDIETYRATLASIGFDPTAFEAAQRTTLRRGQLQRAIRGSSVVPPSGYRRFLNLAYEQRVVTTAEISAESVASEVSVDDEEVAEYYEQNPALYQLPESADVEFVEISREDVAASVQVTEEQLREFYEFNQNRYLRDPQRQARHILILFDGDEDAAEVVANEMLTRVRAGESFAALAEQYSKDGGTSANGGDFGPLTEEQLPAEIAPVIFSMSEGDIEGPIKTDFGFHVVRLDRIIAPGPLPYDQVRASLVTELQEEEADGLFVELQRNMSDALFDSADIRAVASAVGAEVQAMVGFPRSGAAPIGNSQAAIDAIYDPAVLAGSQLSDVVEIDANRAAVFSVLKHNPAQRQSLEDVRDEVSAALTQQKTEDLMASRAQQMIDALAAGDEFELAAEAIGATALPATVMSRDAQSADQFIAVAVFTAVKPTADKPTTGSTRNGLGGYTVYRIDAVVPGRPEAIAVEDRDAGKEQLVDQYGIGDFVAFVQALRANAEVVVNEDALAAQDLL